VKKEREGRKDKCKASALSKSVKNLVSPSLKRGIAGESRWRREEGVRGGKMK